MKVNKADVDNWAKEGFELDDGPQEKALKDMNKAALAEKAADLGIEVPGDVTKAGLVDLIEAALDN